MTSRRNNPRRSGGRASGGYQYQQIGPANASQPMGDDVRSKRITSDDVFQSRRQTMAQGSHISNAPVDSATPKTIPPNGEMTSDGVIKVRKRRKKRMSRAKKVVIVIVCVVAVLCIGAGATAFALYNIGAGNLRQNPDDIQTNEHAVTYDEGRTITYNGQTYVYNENIVSICFIGYDRTENTQGQGQADAIMVAAIDTSNGKTKVIAIPRDSMVDVEQYAGMNQEKFVGVHEMQICLSFAYGDNDTQSSELTTSLVSRVLYNMPIKYYFTLNRYGIGDLADAIGGVYLDPLETIPGTNVVKGEPMVLMGNDAYRYCQYRDISYLTSALDRQAREVQFVKAYFQQLMQMLKDNPSSIFDILGTVSRYTTTNLGASEITYLVGVMLQNSNFDLDVLSLQGEVKKSEDDRFAEVYLDKDNVYQTMLNVYYTPTGENSADDGAPNADQELAG